MSLLYSLHSFSLTYSFSLFPRVYLYTCVDVPASVCKCVRLLFFKKTYDGNNGDMTSLFTSCIHRDDLRCRLDHVICFYNNDIRVYPYKRLSFV